jgi:hypothetical protein
MDYNKFNHPDNRLKNPDNQYQNRELQPAKDYKPRGDANSGGHA